MRALPILALTLGLLGSSSVGSPVGKTEEFPRLGLELERPSSWQRLPVPPREQHTRLMWAVPGGSGRSPSIGVALLFADDADGCVDTRSFLEQRVRPRSLVEERAGARRFGHEPVRFTYEVVDADGVPLTGFVHGWEAPGRTVLVHGRARSVDFAGVRGSWERFAERLVFETPRERSRERTTWTRFYGQRRFPDRELRVEARLSSVEGWDGRDSEHYLVLSHAGDPELTRRCLERLEALREQLTRDLEAIVGSGRTGIVRICRDRDEYLLYGGDPRAWGYFSPSEGELVLHLVDDEAAWMATLQHEAFHQYVFHATGGVSPHSWFDEGLAEHYGTARVEGGRVTGFDQPDGLTRPVRSLLEAGRSLPLADFMAMDRAAYYADALRCYPQGWSVVRWLETEARGRKGELLDTYFRELTRAWGQALLELEDETDPARWRAARDATRATALERALAGQDLRAIERGWQAWAREAR